MPIYDIKSNRDGDIVPLFARFIRGLAGFYFVRIFRNETKIILEILCYKGEERCKF